MNLCNCYILIIFLLDLKIININKLFFCINCKINLITNLIYNLLFIKNNRSEITLRKKLFLNN